MTSASRLRKLAAAAPPGIVAGAGLIGASVALGVWAAAVNAPCKPYAACIDNGHAGRAFGGLLLFALTGIVGLIGLIVLGLSVLALFSKAKTAREHQADLEREGGPD